MKKISILLFLILFSVSVYCQVPSNGLIACYSFNNNTSDFSGYNNNGISYFNVTNTTDRFGIINRALNFDSAFVLVPVSNSVTSPNTGITISSWINLDVLKPYNPIICKSNTISLPIPPQYKLGITNSGQIKFGYNKNGWPIQEILSSPTTIVTNTWMHIAVTFDGNSVKYYKNGVLFSTISEVGVILPELVEPIEIGRDAPSPLENLDGSLDELRIYNRALTYSEIISLFNDSIGCSNIITDSCKTTQISLNTGVDANGNLLPIGAQDMNWKVTSITNAAPMPGFNMPYHPYTIPLIGGWFSPTNSRWINRVDSNIVYGGPLDVQVEYTRSFTTLVDDTFKVKFLLAGDNGVNYLKIDGIIYWQNTNNISCYGNQCTILNDSIIFLNAGCHDISAASTNAWGYVGTNGEGINIEGYIQSVTGDSSILKQNCVTNTPPTLNATDTLNYCANCEYISPNLSITSGLGCGNLDTVKVYFTSGYTQGQDTLQFVPQLGINSSFNPSTGVLTLYGNANYGVWETVLQTVCYKSLVANNANNNNVKNVVISLGNALYNPANGHYYKLVNNGSPISWHDAKNAAAASTYFGMQGYLVTITDSLENNFIKNLIQSNIWLGASDSAAEGVWRWVTGCEGLENAGQGRYFSQQQGTCGAITGTGSIVSSFYNNWYPMEPNDAGCNEDFAHLIYNSNGQWNDLADSPPACCLEPAYVIEYGCMPNDPIVNLASNIIINLLPQSDTIINQTICQGDSFLNYSLAGTYIDTFASASGCDSLRILNLGVNPCGTCDTSLWKANYVTLSGNSNSIPAYLFVDSVNSWTFLNPANAPNSYYASQFSFKDTMCINQEFNIEYRMKASSQFGILAYDMQAGFYTPNGFNNIVLMGDPSGQPSSKIYSNSVLVVSNQSYLVKPSMIDNWFTVKMRYNNLNQELRWYYNDTLLYTATNIGNICSITGLEFSNKGSGYCDWVKITNNNNDTLYFENFNNCNSLNSFQNYCTAPLFTISKINPTCNSDTLKIFVTPVDTLFQNYQYSWSGPNGFISNSQNLIISNPSILTNGTYNCSINSNNCLPDSMYTISISGLIDLYNNSSTINHSICQGQSYLGYTTSGSFIDTFTNVSGCDSIRILNLTVNPLPNVNSTSTPLNGIVCAGNSVALTGTGASSYTWSGGVNNGVSFAPASTATYTVTGTDANGCSNTNTKLITVNPLPSITINSIPNPPTICLGASVTLTANGANTYAWSGGISNSVAFNPSSSTTYTVTGTNANNCSNTNSIAVTVNPLPNVNSTPAVATVCFGQSMTLNGTGANTYTWSGGVINNSPFTINNSTTYTVTGTDANGCSNTNTKLVTVNVLPTLGINPINPSICLNQSVNLTVGGASTYVWSPASGLNQTTGTTVTASPTSTTTYTITGTDANGCSNTISNTVAVNPLPTLSATPSSATLCIGDSVTLNINGASTYTWSPSAGLNQSTGSQVKASPIATTTYTITGTNANGCTSTQTISVTVNPLPVLSILPANPTICLSESITLTANGATSYTWTPNTGLNNTSSPIVIANPTATQIYTVTGTDANGCENTISTTLTVNPLPVLSVLPVNPSICIGNAVNMSVNGASTYTWSPSGGLNTTIGNSVQSNPTVTTSYQVIGTTALGCKDSLVNTVTVNPLPILSTTPLSTTICQGQSTNLTINGANTYAWTPGGSLNIAQGSSVTASPYLTTTYTIVGTDVNSCTSVAQILVNVNPSYNRFDTLELCQGMSYTFGSQTITTAGNYIHTFQTGLSCDSTVNLHVKVYDKPVSNFNLADHACVNEPVLIQNNWQSPQASYAWNVGDGILTGNTPSINVIWTIPGTKLVSLEVATQSPCIPELFVDTIQVHQAQANIIVSDADTFFCIYDQIKLQTPNINGYSYMWSPSLYFNSTSYIAEGVVKEPVTVKVYVKDQWGCEAEDSKYLDVQPCCNAYLPNSFTPNGDGLNDVFRIIGEGNYHILDFYVANRWGNIIFRTIDQNVGWDGKIQGVEQSIDTYYYFLKYECANGDKRVIKGDLTLLR
jgi:gliding motility-associated-like protein